MESIWQAIADAHVLDWQGSQGRTDYEYMQGVLRSITDENNKRKTKTKSHDMYLPPTGLVPLKQEMKTRPNKSLPRTTLFENAVTTSKEVSGRA